MVIQWARLGEIYQIGVKGYVASWIDPRSGSLSTWGKIAYLVNAWEIYKSADLIFERLGWREEISRNITSGFVGCISSLSLVLAAKNRIL